MTNRTVWVGGNLSSGLGWSTSHAAADLAGLPSGSSVMGSNGSSVALSFSNGTSLDQFMDVSCVLALPSPSAVGALVGGVDPGASIAVWLAMLQEDGTTYGDGNFAPGAQTVGNPPWSAIAPIRLYASTRTALVGGVSGIPIPPGTFSLIVQNNSGFSLASSGNACSIRTYNQNLNG